MKEHLQTYNTTLFARNFDNSIRNIRNQIMREIRELDNTYRDNRKNLESLLHNLQKSCPHRNRTYNSDPSGGSDSFWSCDVCGSDNC